MGQQQLLLIILGVIVVGIAVAVGITMFTDSATSANRDAITNDLTNFASRAQQFYRRPIALGGGQGSFTNLTKITQLTKDSTNADAVFTLTGGAMPVTITGTSRSERGTDGNTLKVVMSVWADSAKVTSAN